MKKEEIIILLEKGLEEIEEYYINNKLNDISSQSEKEQKAEEMKDLLLDKLGASRKDKGIVNSIAKFIVDENTITPQKSEKGQKSKKTIIVNYKEIAEDTQDSFELSGFMLTDGKLDRNKLFTFMRDTYTNFFDDNEVNARVKQEILNSVIIQIQEKIGKRKVDKDTEIQFEGKEDKKTLKEILVKFTFEGRKVSKITSIDPTINPSDIKSITDTTKDEYKKLLSEINNFKTKDANSYEKRSLEPLIQFMEDKINPTKKEIRVGNTKIDRLMGTLSLDKEDNRQEIYAYWEDRFPKEKEFADSAKNFYETSKTIIDNLKDDSDLKQALTKYNKAHERLFDSGAEETNPKYSYILEIDVNDSEYKDAMKIETIDDEDSAAVYMIYEFIKLIMPDKAVFLNESFKGLTPQEIEESLSVEDKGEKDYYYNKDEDNKGSAPVGAIDDLQQDSYDTVSGIEKITKEILEGVLDPMYYYLWKNDKLFLNIGLVKKSFNKMKNSLKYFSSIIFSYEDYASLKLLEEFLRRIEEDLILTNTKKNKLYLPITKKLVELFQDAGITVNNNDEEILLYLKAVEGIVNFGENLIKNRQSILVSARRQSPDAKDLILDFGNYIDVGQEGKDLRDEEEIFEWVDSFNELIDSINLYFIIPSNTMYMPFGYDDLPKFSRWSEGTFIGTKTDEKIADSLQAIFKLEYGPINILTLEEIKDLTENLRKWNSIDDGVGERISDLNEIGDTMVNTVVAALLEEGDFKKDAETELGALLHSIKKREMIDDVIIFAGRNTKEWSDLFQENRFTKTWPFKSLVNHLYRKRAKYEDIPDARKIMQDFFGVIDNMPIVKSETELKILRGHDMIRKLMGKPIHYGTCKTNNFDHVNNALSILKSNYNVELTPFELESIVEEQDAHKNLGIKYGISTDAVYYLKGKFR